MAIFQTVANTVKAIAIGERVKVTLRPETGQFPNPVEGHLTHKEDSGDFMLKAERGLIQIRAADILSITRLER